jgi:hypothetical protein
MTIDDISIDYDIKFPIDYWTQEKIDGANMGVSWDDGPILRDRKHILTKGYSKIKTPAKSQFVPAWNWIHEHEFDIKKVERLWESPITIYGEWMFLKHSIYYDKLPDFFVAYDIYSVIHKKFLSPDVMKDLLSETNIKFINPYKKTFLSINDIVKESEKESEYREGIVEGIVLKKNDGYFITDTVKVVNRYFKRRENFNEELIKNKLL